MDSMGFLIDNLPIHKGQPVKGSGGCGSQAKKWLLMFQSREIELIDWLPLSDEAPDPRANRLGKQMKHQTLTPDKPSSRDNLTMRKN